MIVLQAIFYIISSFLIFLLLLVAVYYLVRVIMSAFYDSRLVFIKKLGTIIKKKEN